MAITDQQEMRREIEEIVEDSYSEEEQKSAWEVAFQDDIETPFKASMLGIPVEVHAFRLGTLESMQCLIRWDGSQRWVGIEDLDAAGLPEDFTHLLALYRVWRGGDY